MRRLLVLIGLVAAWFVVSLQAATREVGSGQTYTTIQACHDAATAGDICNIHAGAYTETVTVTKSLTFRNNSGESPVLTGSFTLGSTANVTITCNTGGGAMEIKDWADALGVPSGIYQSVGTGLTVTGCKIHGGYGPSVYSRNSTKLLIQDNEVYGLLEPSLGNYDANGLMTHSCHSTDSTYANGCQVLRNTIHDNHVDGIQIQGQYFTIANNNVYNNIATDWATTHPDGIQINGSGNPTDGYDSAQHVKIFNNIFRNQNQNIFLAYGAGGDCTDIWVWNNIAYNETGTVNGVDLDSVGASNMVSWGCEAHILHNYFGRAGGNAIYVAHRVGDASLVTVENNIFANRLAGGLGVYVVDAADIAAWDYNLYYSAGQGGDQIRVASTYYTTGAAFRAGTVYEDHGIDGDPLINALPTPTLQAGSPAINAGIDITGTCSDCVTDKAGVTRGNPPEIGPYEFGTVTTVGGRFRLLRR